MAGRQSHFGPCRAIRAQLVCYQHVGRRATAAGAGGGGGPDLPLGRQDVHSQGGQRCEVAAALKMGGRGPYLVAGERDWVLSRIAEKPDLTPRAVLGELAGRGLGVSDDALWRFLQHEG